MLLKIFKPLVTITILVLLAVFSLWLQNFIEPLYQPANVSGSVAPDYYFDQFELIKMNDIGEPDFLLRAQHLTHYPDTDHSLLDYPHVDFFRANNAIWIVDAKKGNFYSDKNEVILIGQVVLQNVAAKGLVDSTLMTSKLLVRLNEDYAETDEAVTIKNKIGITKGVGMQVYINKEHIKLFSQVKGVYIAN